MPSHCILLNKSHHRTWLTKFSNLWNLRVRVYNKNHSYTGIQMLATLPHRKDRATCLLEFFWKEGRIGWLVKFLWNNGQFHDNLHVTADVVFIASSPLSQYHIDLLSDGNPSHLGIPKKKNISWFPQFRMQTTCQKTDAKQKCGFTSAVKR